MEITLTMPTNKDFQVAGVSRSGRVRKKSSKLLDFESPDEIEKKTKRYGRQPARYPGRGRPPNALREREPDISYADNNINITDAGSHALLPVDVRGVLMNSDDELDTLVQDLVEGVEAEATNESRVQQSLYMREKSNKRKMLKDGKIVTGKMQRKDKGKSRYTAYSLWAREVRKRDFQDLDFANAARRLSELWANVSNKEKNAWRRKAKIQATKARTKEKSVAVANSSSIPTSIASNGTVTAESPFANRATTSRTKKLAAERRQPQEQQDATKSKRSSTTRGRGAAAANNQNITGAGGIKHASGMRAIVSPNELELNSAKVSQVSGIAAIDAAAHLRLLGESLTVIGERLKEHNGRVALSGSLSVLLDSLLCSMGPLLCMTTQIPGLENKKQLCTNLATTLDNIAYVMPGL